jgi:hypothetical protein
MRELWDGRFQRIVVPEFVDTAQCPFRRSPTLASLVSCWKARWRVPLQVVNYPEILFLLF